MKKKKIRLKYKKERVLFSDVLPYELPFIFTNRYFYRFLVENQVEISENNHLTWKDSIGEGAKSILACMCGLKLNEKKNDLEIREGLLRTIPFTYTILHKPTRHRELSIIHPLNQIKIVDFYDKYKDIILYLCSKSHFSIRYPQKVATCFFYKDRLHRILLGKKTDTIEMFYAEYENLKTFFSYKSYSNIYKFYESYRYQRAEKKFDHLIRLDIQSCFDSIYTHSVAWAIYGGKDIYKDNFKYNDLSFGYNWDKMMQDTNYGETNGIVIGPEFSRIFAEVILQHIDQRVERDLKNKGYKLNVDYECYRYVDDYFFFYNDDKVKNEALNQFEKNLKEFKLYINNEKKAIFDRPFITNITKAKISIFELIDGVALIFNSAIEKIEKDDINDNRDNNVAQIKDIEWLQNTICATKFHSTVFCKKFKKCISDNDVEYKDVLNYAMVRLSLCVERQLKKFDKIYKLLCIMDIPMDAGLKDRISVQQEKMEQTLAKFLIEIINSVFFLYASNKLVNTTLKTLQILNKIITYLDNDYIVTNAKKEKKSIKRFSDYIREIVFKKIRDEISLVLHTAPLDEYVQLETMYFLIFLRKLNKKYQLNADEIKKYLKITYETDDKNKVVIKHFPTLNAISIIILFYYFGSRSEYDDLKAILINKTFEKFDNIPSNRLKKSAEFIILALDLAACPYIKKSDRRRLLQKIGLSRDKGDGVIEYMKHQKFMFTKWTGIDITKELNAKISHEVYS